MNKNFERIRQSVNWGGGRIRALLVLVLVIGLIPAAPVSAPAVASNIQPLLLEMAAQQPDQVVSVIVQKSAKDTRVEAAVSVLGGTVTKDLHIINAFAAQMTAKDVAQLARSSGVRWVSLDAPMVKTGGPDGTVNTSALLNVYNKAIGADKLWAAGYQGSSVTVAVVDSGIALNSDFNTTGVPSPAPDRGRIIGTNTGASDAYGHGTHIGGIIAGNGANSGGKYIGIAPKVNLVNVQVSDSMGASTESDVVNGLQWVYNNRATYNIRVVNLSLNSTTAQSYLTSPMDAALEILWFNGIVVVVSAGNAGLSMPGVVYPPANDPFVITVGAVNDNGTAATSDDVLSSYSSYGTLTEINPDLTTYIYSKPDLVAPGSNIVSLLAKKNDVLDKQHPSNEVGTSYFKMSGTSMAAAVASGAVALLLQDEPNLTPDQVKYRLKATAQAFAAGNGAPYIDIYAAVNGTTTQSANTGITASQLLWTGSTPSTWGSVQWNSVQWNSVQWNSVQWNSVQWNSVQWNSDYWGP